MFGISSGEFVILIVVAAVVLGPERLPHYAQQLARLIKELRRMAQGATEQVRAELGPEFDEVDWRKLDPRQYDPRRIVREALSDTIDTDDPLGLKGYQNDEPASPDGLLSRGRGGGRHAAPPPDPAPAGGPGAVPGQGAAARGGSPVDVPFDPDAT